MKKYIAIPKVTFITTVFNEADTIDSFLQSLFSQTVMPDEIIIVDGKSTDKTRSVILGRSKATTPESRDPGQARMTIKLLAKKGNRSVGRNFAITHARNDIILCSDVGCVLDKDWVKNMSKHFTNPNVDVVSGFYLPIADSVFQKCLATYTCTQLDQVDPKDFLPASRSIAFRKKVWQNVKGYPEHLDTCEDLIFVTNLKKIGCRFIFEKNAIVYWQQKKNLWEAFFQFFNYAKGDGKAHYFRSQTPLLFLRYLVAIMLIVLSFVPHLFAIRYTLYAIFVLYILLSIHKNYRYINSFKAFLFLPLLQFTADIAVIFGTIVGFVSAFQTKDLR